MKCKKKVLSVFNGNFIVILLEGKIAFLTFLKGLFEENWEILK